MPSQTIDNEIILLIEEIRMEKNIDKKKQLVKRLRELMNRKKHNITSRRILKRKEIKLPIAKEVREIVEKTRMQPQQQTYKQIVGEELNKIKSLEVDLEKAKKSGNNQEVKKIEDEINKNKLTLQMFKEGEKQQQPAEEIVAELKEVLKVIPGDEKSLENYIKATISNQNLTERKQKQKISQAMGRYDNSLTGDLYKGSKKKKYDEIMKKLKEPKQNDQQLESKQDDDERLPPPPRRKPSLPSKQKSIPSPPPTPPPLSDEESEPDPGAALASVFASASVPKGQGRRVKYRGGAASMSDYLSTFSNIPGFSQAMGMLPIVGPLASVFGSLGQTGSKVASNAMRGKGVQMRGCGVPGIGDLASMVGQDLNSAFNVFKDFKGMFGGKRIMGMGTRRDIKSVTYNDYMNKLYSIADMGKRRDIVNMKNVEEFNNRIQAKENAEQQNAVYQLLYNKLLEERQDKSLQEDTINKLGDKKKRILL